MKNPLVSWLALAALLLAAPAAAKESPLIVGPAAGGAAPLVGGRFDHGALGILLRKYVDGNGRVDYAAWKGEGVRALRGYLESLAAVDPQSLADRDERLAYWINAYNALTIYGILRFYPTSSIKNHVSHFFGFHFWDDVRLVVDGTERSLSAIEHQILRKKGEPRIHFAINCASKGCPRLRAEPYTGAGLEEQLERAARVFFTDPEKFRIDPAGRRVHFSPIFKWFGEDFGGTGRAKLDWAAGYVADPHEREFLEKDDMEIRYLDYDWSLNGR